MYFTFHKSCSQCALISKCNPTDCKTAQRRDNLLLLLFLHVLHAGFGDDTVSVPCFRKTGVWCITTIN